MKSWEAVRWVFAQAQAKGSAKLVLVNLAFHYNEREKAAWPGEGCIQRETGLKIDTITKALRKLESLRLIVKLPRKGSHGQYRFMLQFDVSQPPQTGDSMKNVDSTIWGLDSPILEGVDSTIWGDKPVSQPQKKRNHSTLTNVSDGSLAARAKKMIAAFGTRYLELFETRYIATNPKAENNLVKKVLGQVSDKEFAKVAEEFLHERASDWSIKNRGRTLTNLCQNFIAWRDRDVDVLPPESYGSGSSNSRGAFDPFFSE